MLKKEAIERSEMKSKALFELEQKNMQFAKY